MFEGETSIFVCPLDMREALIKQSGASHVATLLSPDMLLPTPQGIEPDNHLNLSLNDIETAQTGYQAPELRHAQRLVEFATEVWTRQAPLLVHCWFGVSRSTAGALIAVAALCPQRDEAELAWELRFLAPFASPNRALISCADQVLGRQGRLIEAVEQIGRGEDCHSGTPFEWKFNPQI